MMKQLTVILLVSQIILSPLSLQAIPEDATGAIALKPGSKAEIDRLTKIVSSLLYRDEYQNWVPPVEEPTRKALRAQVESFINSYTQHLERTAKLQGRREEKAFRNNLYNQVLPYVERTFVQREKIMRFGDGAPLFSPADFPEPSENDYLDKMARAIAHLTVALEKKKVDDLKDRQAISALGVRLIAESYISAGATEAANRYMNWHTPFVWSVILVIGFAGHSLAEGAIYPALDWIREWWADGHPHDAIAKMPEWGYSKLQEAAIKTALIILPPAIGVTWERSYENNIKDKRALAAAERLMRFFWLSVDSYLNILSPQSSKQALEASPHQPAESSPEQLDARLQLVQRRVWDNFLQEGAVAKDAIPQSKCEALLGKYLEAGDANPWADQQGAIQMYRLGQQN